jgi:hypothetical protein
MIEFIFGFGAGYFLHKMLTGLSMPQFEMLLRWDREILSWRAVVPGSVLNPTDRYIAAIEVEPEHVRVISETLEDNYP